MLLRHRQAESGAEVQAKRQFISHRARQKSSLLVGEQFQHRPPLGRIRRVGQDLAVVEKILFVDVTLHGQTSKGEARVLLKL